MEKETLTSDAIPVVNIAEQDEINIINSPKVKVEDIEAAFDGEFIKIEESSFDAKGRTITAESSSTTDEKLGLKSLYKKILENQKVEEALKITAAELSTAQGELELSKSQVQEVEQRLASKEASINELTEELGTSTARYSDLELELKNAMDKCAENEGRANTIHQRSDELEDLKQISHAKAVEAGKKVSELELLLETEKYRIKKLEEQRKAAEAEFLKNTLKVSELEGQLEAVQVKNSSLEVALQAATEKEKELTEHLHITTEENRNLKDTLKTTNEKLSEAKKLRHELSTSKQKLESIENDLKAARMRKNEVIEKLKPAKELLQEQGRVLEKATLGSIKLESLHRTLTRESDQKLQEALANFTRRDSEAKSLKEILTSLEGQVKSHQELLAEANERYAAVKEELDQIVEKLASSENANKDLKQKILDEKGKAEQHVAEKELLADTNLQLSKQAKELDEKLNLVLSEKKLSDNQLASHTSTITELIKQHSRAIELQLATEARVSGAEAQLEREVKKKSELTQELASYKSKLSDLETKLSTVSSEKNDAVEKLRSAKKEIEYLRQTLQVSTLAQYISKYFPSINGFQVLKT
ncbi:Hypothetical predicted protein [Olea europaea subsp. europaea]|uniref:Uncharacterized protein n=1 Tax=Olea europaea subsp. europaea TaxID=158383 RepID=A0A8S0U154_OLEEU|nr:Hypothetical predicted protein [Olea europaea subsp. europaea]